MMDLALHHGGVPVSLREIAERQGISEKYLWNLIAPLKTTGLIRSTRGSNGGFTIAKPFSQISLKDIVHILEGPLCMAECVADPTVYDCFSTCVTRDIWSEAEDRIQQVFESITLEDMVERQRKTLVLPRCEV